MTAIAELRALLLETTEGVMPDMLAVETQLLIRVLGEYGALKRELRDALLTGPNAAIGKTLDIASAETGGMIGDAIDTGGLGKVGRRIPVTEQL